MGHVRKIVFACALASAIALSALLPTLAAADPPAAPFETNEECLGCHDLATGSGAFTKVDFGASTVDLNNCRPCHWKRSHFEHGLNVQCNTSGCHVGFPTRTVFWYSRTYTPYGYFNSAASIYTDPATLHRIHVNGSWPETLKVANNYCDSCHAPAACKACHSATPAHDPHATPTYPAVGYQQAIGTYTYGTYNAITTPATCVNSSCHDRAGARAGATKPFIPFCGSCHPANIDTHGYDTVDHVADVGSAIDPMGGTCGSCHSMDLLSEHEKSSSAPSGRGCATCHPNPRNSFEAWEQGCEQSGCHAVGSPQQKHLNAAGGHVPAAGNDICFDCHDGTDLPSIHVAATTTTPLGEFSGCNVCHRPDADVLSNDCAVCHFTFEGHYDGTLHTSTWTLSGCDSSGCHTTRDLMGVHQEQNPAFTCQGCHGSGVEEVVAAIATGDTACGACHGGVTQTEGHRAVHWSSPLLQDATGPHYSYWTGSAGTQPTGDCAGCHVSNLVDEHLGIYDAETGNPIRLPRQSDTGEALDCATCHDSEDISVQAAILGGFTTCEACHAVHGPIQDVHASNFVDTPEYDCGLCHESNLANEHNGSFTVVTPGGTALTGCDVCHAYYETPRGTEVQNAISQTNDTRCSACHAAYHGGAGASHTANTTPSIEGCGDCHDDDPDTDGMDVTVVHAGAAAGPCSVCHANPARVPDIATKTAECASCHAASGTDYHRNMSVHASPDAALCSGQCHHQNPDVTAIHPACTTCHTVVDTENQDTSCTNCHLIQGVDYHPNFTEHHTPVDAGSTDCARCHETTDIRELHVTNGCETCHTGECANCHTPHGGMGGGYLLRGTQCSVCHTTSGTDYHLGAGAKHTFEGIDPSCVSAGCHASNSLPEAHEAHLARYPQYADTCALCHLNDDSGRIDWSTASADCSSCHEVHGDIDAIHQAPGSQACVDCHETADVRDIHPACDTCHNGTTDTSGTTACGNTGCHVGYVPPDPNHYPAAPHAATTASGCTKCHSADMKTEHFKPTVGPVSCVECHETKVDGFTAAWDKSCDACHTSRHGNQNARHVSTRSDCGDSGCHPTADVSDIHDGTPTSGGPGGGTTVTETLFTGGFEPGNFSAWTSASGWTVRNDQKRSGSYAARQDTTNLSTLEKRASASGLANLTLTFWLKGNNNTEDADWVRVYATSNSGGTWTQVSEKTLGDRNSSWTQITVAIPDAYASSGFGFQIRASVSSIDECQYVDDVLLTGGRYTPPQTPSPPTAGCEKCHTPTTTPSSTDCGTAGCHPGLTGGHHEIHNAAAANPTGCGGCHFTYLDDEHLNLGYTCATCHDSTSQAVQDAIAAGKRTCVECHPDNHYESEQRRFEFNPNNSSMHRASADLPGMRDSFVVNGITRTWTRPSTSSFLKSGWTYDSVVACSDCHTYSGAVGPHGATMQVNIDPAYTGDYGTATLSSYSGIICTKCHTSFRPMNGVHDEGDHDGSDGRCVNCHTQIPHGWSMPRLLAYSSDPAPYNSLKLRGIRVNNYSPSYHWDESNCAAACDDHGSSVTGAWPSGAPLPPPEYGTITGRVTTSDGVGILGALVEIAGEGTTQTDASGYFTISSYVGSTHVTAAAPNYTAASSTVIVVKDQTATLDFALTYAPTMGNITGTVVSSTSGAAISGATVSLNNGSSTTTAADGAYTLANVTAGTYTMTVTKTDYTTWTGAVTVAAAQTTTQNVALASAGTTNLALGKTFNATDWENSTYAPDKAGDGSTSTFWWSDNRGYYRAAESIWVDLASQYRVGKVEIVWYGNYWARDYKVYVSRDNRAWDRVYETSSGSSGTKTITFSGRDARYVKVECRRAGSSGNTGYGMAELRVFESTSGGN